jgi:hypothetical protein
VRVFASVDHHVTVKGNNQEQDLCRPRNITHHAHGSRNIGSRMAAAAQTLTQQRHTHRFSKARAAAAANSVSHTASACVKFSIRTRMHTDIHTPACC